MLGAFEYGLELIEVSTSLLTYREVEGQRWEIFLEAASSPLPTDAD